MVRGPARRCRSAPRRGRRNACQPSRRAGASHLRAAATGGLSPSPRWNAASTSSSPARRRSRIVSASSTSVTSASRSDRRVSGASVRRSRRSSRYRSSSCRCRPCSRRLQSRRERAKVSGSCASGRIPGARDRRELARPTRAHALVELRVRVVGEVQERRRLAVLLAHEQQGHERREQHDAGDELDRLEAHERRQPLAERPVADLVVVLGVHDEVAAVEAHGRSAVASPAELRLAPVVDEALAERLGDVAERAEVDVVALALARDRGVHGVVQVVAPGRVEPEAARRRPGASRARRSGRSPRSG